MGWFILGFIVATAVWWTAFLCLIGDAVDE